MIGVLVLASPGDPFPTADINIGIGSNSGKIETALESPGAF